MSKNPIKKKKYCNLKVDKGKGDSTANKDKYTGKSVQTLNTNQFVKLDSGPTKTTERIVQTVLQKTKWRFSRNKYKQLYPIGSSPGKFYGAVKILKLPQDDQVNKLPYITVKYIGIQCKVAKTF